MTLDRDTLDRLYRYSYSLTGDEDRAYVLLLNKDDWRVRAKFSFKTKTSVVLTDSNQIESLPSGSGLLRGRDRRSS